MSTFMQVVDGVSTERSALPSRFTRRLSDGAWSIPTEETAAEFGWFPVTETDPPVADPWDSVERTVVHDGTGFVTEWTITRGVQPLVDPADYPSEDERVASVALLTEDSVGYRAVVELLIAKGIISVAEVTAARAKAMQRLVLLADNPDVRRQMMQARLAAAEQLRD